MENLRHENIWLNKYIYEDAEVKHYESLAKVCTNSIVCSKYIRVLKPHCKGFGALLAINERQFIIK